MFQIGSYNVLVEREEELSQEQKVNFDRCHRAQYLLPALSGDQVWIPDKREQGTIGDEMAPQSYEVETPSSTFRINRRGIIHLPAEDISPGIPESHNSDSEETTSEDRSQSGELKGELLSPPTHSLCWNSRVTYNPHRYDPCAL